MYKFKNLKIVVFFLSIVFIGCQNPFENQEKKEINDSDEDVVLNLKNAKDLNWVEGFEVEIKEVKDVNNGEIIDYIVYAKIPQDKFHIKILESYPPKSLSDWCQNPDNILVINGGFFTENYKSTAILISDQGKSGQSYQGKDKGIFYIDQNNNFNVSNLEKKVDYSQMKYAIETFPMLVDNYINAVSREYETKESKRSFVGIHQDGDLIIGNSVNSNFSMYDLGDYLDDLEIKTALNLDGGSSSGLCLRDKDNNLVYEDYNLAQIPDVIVITR